MLISFFFSFAFHFSSFHSYLFSCDYLLNLVTKQQHCCLELSLSYIIIYMYIYIYTYMTYLFLNTPYKLGTIIIPVSRWRNGGPERLSDLNNLPKVTQLEEGRAGVKPEKFGPWVCALNHHIISTLSPGCQFLYLCCWCNNKGTCGDVVKIWGNVHPGPCRVPGTPEWLGKWRLWWSPSLSLQPIPECPGPSYVHTDKSERKQSPRRKQGWGRALEASGTARCKFKPPCLLIGSPWANHLTLVKFPKGSNGRNNIYILGLLRRLNVEMYLALCQAQQKLGEAGLLMLLSFPGRWCLALQGKEVSLTPGDYWDSAVTWGWPPEELRPWNPHSPPSPNHFLHPLSKFAPSHSIPLMLSGVSCSSHQWFIFVCRTLRSWGGMVIPRGAVYIICLWAWWHLSCTVYNLCIHTWQSWWDGGLPWSAFSCGFHSAGSGIKRSQEWQENVHQEACIPGHSGSCREVQYQSSIS